MFSVVDVEAGQGALLPGRGEERKRCLEAPRAKTREDAVRVGEACPPGDLRPGEVAGRDRAGGTPGTVVDRHPSPRRGAELEVVDPHPRPRDEWHMSDVDAVPLTIASGELTKLVGGQLGDKGGLLAELSQVGRNIQLRAGDVDVEPGRLPQPLVARR